MDTYGRSGPGQGTLNKLSKSRFCQRQGQEAKREPRASLVQGCSKSPLHFQLPGRSIRFLPSLITCSATVCFRFLLQPNLNVKPRHINLPAPILSFASRAIAYLDRS